jgi:hypothetical protein
MMSANRLLLMMRVAIVVAALAGCLDFEEQTARVEHDQDNDRLTVVINYRGLYAAQDNPTSSDAEAQLQEALENEGLALGGNWPFAFQLAELRTELKKPDGTYKDWPEELRQNFLTLVERISVRNGGFYIDPGGRVCGAQVVTVEKVQDSVQLFNTIVNQALQVAAQDEKPADPFDQRMLEYAQKNHTWLEPKGHSFVISIPVTEEELDEGRRDSVEELFEPPQGDSAEIRLRGIKDLFSSPVLLWHEDGMLKVKCGLETKPSVLVLKPRLGKYTPNLAEHIEQTYGLHLDANLARYILQPDSPAEMEAEEAARIMAPRLTKSERVRVLVHQLSTEPSEDYWAKLREEPFARGMDESKELADAELLESWRQWLQSQAPAFKEPEAAPEG